MDAPFPIENRANLPTAEFNDLAGNITSHRSIKHALDWLISLNPPCTFKDMVTQDEFSHDIVAEFSDGLYLVYDVT